MAFKFPFKLPQRARSPEYPDDIFDDTRMSFGDHIEELRSRLIKALYGLAICLSIGFVLDYVGKSMGWDNFGIGVPMMKVITDPVESQVRNFYKIRNDKAKQRLSEGFERTPEEEARLLRDKVRDANGDINALSEAEKKKLLNAPVDMPIILPAKAFRDAGVTLVDPSQTEISLLAKVYPAYVSTLSNDGETYLGTRKYLTTLSAQEAFMVYFKVSLLCGAIIASPWIFYHLWAFVSAGLYPHEKRYIHLYLPVSVGLFLGGVLLCQFWVMPGAVKALLGFNNWIDLDPDLRLNEWLGFALLLPVVFGVSFQAPLVMFFLTRIGVCTYKTFLDYWRAAVMILAVVAAVLTPTPDVVTLLYLFVPMMGLYLLGIWVCYLFPPKRWDDEQDADSQVAV
ncbi:MAG: twin-arginine translocase subunit TatC [Fimbriiglobus sp.]|nr:twin-arginine translocase subunit TatC [Fimbriiglobus sp.]